MCIYIVYVPSVPPKQDQNENCNKKNMYTYNIIPILIFVFISIKFLVN